MRNRTRPPNTAQPFRRGTPVARDCGVTLWTGASRPLRLRGARRRRAVRDVTAATAGLRWTRGLLILLLEELYVEDEIGDFVGEVGRIALDRVPHVLAVAIALRHSWRADDLAAMTRRLLALAQPP